MLREREKIVIIFIGNLVQRLSLVSVFLIANIVFRFTVISEYYQLSASGLGRKVPSPNKFNLWGVMCTHTWAVVCLGKEVLWLRYMCTGNISVPLGRLFTRANTPTHTEYKQSCRVSERWTSVYLNGSLRVDAHACGFVWYVTFHGMLMDST